MLLRSGVVFAVLALVCTVGYSQGRWQRFGPINYTAVVHQSASTIVAASSHGSLYRSTDGGRSWVEQQLSDSLHIADIAFVDSLHAAIVDAGGAVLFSSNGGGSWMRTLVTPGLTKLAYTSKDTCYVADYRGNVWRTYDRGNNWSPTSTASRYWMQCLSFPTASHGFAGGMGGEFYETNDAGVTWKKRELYFAADSISLFDIDFWDANIGIVAGWGYVWVTTDAGSTWTFRPTPVNWHSLLETVTMTGPTSFFAMGRTTQFYRSTDLGATISAASVIRGDASGDASGSVYDPVNGAVIVGNNGVIYRSSDGSEWSVVTDCPQFNRVDAEIVDHQIAYVPHQLLSGNVIIQSRDTGRTWVPHGLRPVGYDDEDMLSGLHFISKDTALIFTSNQLTNTIMTTNNGASWDSAGVARHAGFRESSFRGRDGYAISDNQFFATHDGGLHWIFDSLATVLPSVYSDATPALGYLRSPVAVNSNVGYALGFMTDTLNGNPSKFEYHNNVYGTSDGGIRWKWICQSPAAFGFALYFQTPSTGFVGGKNGDIYRTSDAGAHWSKAVTPTTDDIYSFDFISDSVGFAGTSGKDRVLILKTTDAGATWENDSLRIPYIDGAVETWRLAHDSDWIVAFTTNGFYRQQLPKGQLAVVNAQAEVNPINFMYISYYPSPASDIVHCRLHGMFSNPNGQLTAGLYDLLGRRITDLSDVARKGNNGAAAEFDLDVRALPAGLYVLEYSLGSVGYRKPFVVVR